MRDTEPPRVVVADIGTDAALYSEPGNRVLVLRPGQTFSNAVAAAQRCLPNAHPDVIRTVVRTYLPDAPDFDLPSVPPLRNEPVRTAPVRTAPAAQPRWFMSRTVMVGILCVATALSLGGWGLVGIGTDEPPAAAANPGPAAAHVRQAGLEPYKNDAFRDFAKRGELTCNPDSNAMRASCTDWEGSAMLSEATIGAERIIFTFQYGKERVNLGIFTKPQDAALWAKMNQDRQGVRVEGRYVLWGTDKDKLDSYQQLLVKARPDKQSTGAVVPSADHPEHGASATSAEFDVTEAARSLAELLPKQLGAIVMGTLGVTSETVDRAGRVGIDQALSPAVAVAVRLALGVPPPPSTPPGNAADEDILTIANEPLPVPKAPKPAPKAPAPDPAPPSDPQPDPAPPPSDPQPDPQPAPPPSDPAPPPSDPAPPPVDPPPADPEPSPAPSDPDPSPSPGPGTEDDGGDPAPAPNDDSSEKGPTTDEGVPTETGDPTTPPGDNGGNGGDNGGNNGGDTKTESESDQTSPAPEQPQEPAPGPEEHSQDDSSDSSNGGDQGDEATVPTDEQSSGDESSEDCPKHDEPAEEQVPTEVS